MSDRYQEMVETVKEMSRRLAEVHEQKAALLEACRWAVSDLAYAQQHGSFPNGSNRADIQLLIRLRVAIAKAEGRHEGQ